MPALLASYALREPRLKFPALPKPPKAPWAEPSEVYNPVLVDNGFLGGRA